MTEQTETTKQNGDGRTPFEEHRVDTGTWVILEIFGHKTIAGYMSKDESLGIPMVRIDVPATSNYPAFTRHYHPNAIYSVSYVGEEAARYTAEAVQENPVSVYVPELGELTRLQNENRDMKDRLFRLQRAMQLGPGHEDD